MKVEMVQHKRQAFYGWRLVTALAGLEFLNAGLPVTGGAVINTYMLRQIPMSRATYGLGFTLLNLAVDLTSVAVAASIVGRGVKPTLAIGSGLIVAGSLWLSFFTSRPWQYLMGFGVVLATGVSFGSFIPITTAVTRWFKRYRGRAMAVALGASALPGFFVAPGISRFLAANGGNWRQGWKLIAGMAVLSAVVAILFVKERPEDFGQVVDGPPEDVAALAPTGQHADTAVHEWTSREAYGTTAYWMIVIGGIACKFPFFFLLAHWILRLEASGFTPSEAAWALSIFGIAGVAGRLIGGCLMDMVAGRHVFMLGLCCYLAAALLTLHTHRGTLFRPLAASIFFGIGFGWTLICMFTIIAQYYGALAYPQLSGTMFLLTGAVAAPAGIVGGKVFDLHRNYALGFELIILLSALGILALGAAKPPKPAVIAPTSAVQEL